MKRLTTTGIAIIMVMAMTVLTYAEPINSAWDGSVSQVENWCDNNLKDPDSRDSISWYEVAYHGVETGYMCRYKFRSKNSFGGYVINDWYFFMKASSPYRVYTVMERDGTIIY